ncbi:hypothetical protein [Kibdelosporangium aridum]|uniref:hypothetical protein n=1 Tax=Kibdelosporangium aridum TaxID=2030 RepID=UPI000525666F
MPVTTNAVLYSQITGRSNTRARTTLIGHDCRRAAVGAHDFQQFYSGVFVHSPSSQWTQGDEFGHQRSDADETMD